MSVPSFRALSNAPPQAIIVMREVQPTTDV
jgi:hypothetical protein